MSDCLGKVREDGEGKKEGLPRDKKKVLGEMDMFIILTLMISQVHTCVKPTSFTH